MMMFSLSSIGGSISASGFGPGVPNLGGSNSARTPATVVEFSLLEYFNWRFHERQRINAISVGKKKGETYRIGSALRLSEMRDYSIQRLHDAMVSRQSSHSMTSCPQQIVVPFAVCIFGGFGEIALAAVTTKNTRMSNRSAHTKMA